MGNSVKKNKALIKACKTNDLDAFKRAFTRELDFWGERYNEPAAINCTDSDGNSPLIHAAERGYRSIAEDLLARGADVNLRNRNEETALIKAAAGGYNDVLAALLDKDADINAKDSSGKTALMHATEAGKSGTVVFLLGRNADVNIRDNQGRTALWHAARRGDVVSLRALIEHGADIDAQDNDGNTALMKAAYAEKKSAVEILLAHNARADLMNNSGREAASLTDSSSLAGLIRSQIRHQQFEKALPSAAVRGARRDLLPEVSGRPPLPEAPQSPIGTAMEREGLNPEKSEHWIPMGDDAIDYVQAGAQSPRFLSTSFNFAAQQYSSISGNLLTGDRIVTQSGGLGEFPNQGLVITAYEKLIEMGKTPKASALYKKPPAGPQ